MTKRRALFIGGPGRITSSTIAQMGADGWELGLLTRPKELDLPGVTLFLGDRDDRAVLEAAAGFAPDVVIDSICFDARQATQATAVFSGLEQYIFVSTVDVYGHPLSELPVREQSALRTPNTDYAKKKREAELAFLTAFAERGYPVTIARVGYSLGSGFVISLFSHDGRGLVDRLRAGLPVVTPGGGTTLLQPACAVDTGRQLASIAGMDETVGLTLNLVGPTAITHDAYVQLVASAVGREANIVHVPTEFILELNDARIQDGLLPGLTRFDLAYSNDLFDTLVPGFERSLTLEDGIRLFVERHARTGRRVTAEEAVDAQILATWESRHVAHGATSTER